MDWSDGLILVGLLIVCLSVYLALGGAAAMGFVGVVLLVMGLRLAWIGRGIKGTGD